MRKFKFRVFNKTTKVMIQPHAISEDIISNSDLVVMQFTGLLDKEKKEIYEGDIVRGEEPLFESGVYNYEVIWIKGSFMIKTNEFSSLEPIMVIERGDFKIIGNKFENPKLLEV